MYLPPSQVEGEGGMGGLREISREWEQGKCGRREAREGGWEVSRIPRGLANALEWDSQSGRLSSRRGRGGDECQAREEECKRGDETRQLASSSQSKMMTAEALLRAARSWRSLESKRLLQARRDELRRMKWPVSWRGGSRGR